jgi:site-specific recombinase XerD
MNEITVPLQKEITLQDLTSEQFRTVERASIFDDLKAQYKKLRMSLDFSIIEEIGNWLGTVNSVHTSRMYLTAVNHFLRYCSNDVLGVTAKEADKYILFLKEDKCSGGTVKLYFRAVSSFYTHLERYDLIKKNPFKNTKIKVDATPKDKYIPSEEDIYVLEDYILDTYSGDMYIKMRIAVSLMKKYGVRVGFLDNIKVKDNALTSFSKGKNHKVVLDGEEDIAYFNHNKEILEGLNSHTISKYFNDSVKALYHGHRIGGEFSPHCLRHYFTMKYYSKYGGSKIVELKKLLGHGSLQATMIYLRSLGATI